MRRMNAMEPTEDTKSPLKILIVGNGIEIYFNDNFSKSKMIRKMNKGSLDRPSNIEKNLSAYYKSRFNEDLGLTKEDFQVISDVINQEGHDKSIEILFENISKGLANIDKVNKIKRIFLDYLQSNSEKTNSYDTEKILFDTLNYYDVIITTNYTDLIERTLEGFNFPTKPKVIHIHGSYKEDGLECLLGLDKSESAYKTERYEYQKLNGLLDLMNDHQYKETIQEKINFDVFGLSINEDERLIGNIVRWFAQVNMDKLSGSYWNTNGQWWNEDQLKIFFKSLSSLFTILYYWHTKGDKKSFEKEMTNEGEIKIDLLDVSGAEDEKWQSFVCAMLGTTYREAATKHAEEVEKNHYSLAGILKADIAIKASDLQSSYFIRDEGGLRTIRIPEVGHYISETQAKVELRKLKTGGYTMLNDEQKILLEEKLEKFIKADEDD